jgi:hypothetical protein
MWIIAGAKTKARPVEGGRIGLRHCDGCDKNVRFQECDVKDTYTAFFVELFDSTQRRMVCIQCGEDHDVAEFFQTAREVKDEPEPAKPSLWSRLRGRAEAKPRDDDSDVEEELAALKRKLAKKDPP